MRSFTGYKNVAQCCSMMQNSSQFLFSCSWLNQYWCTVQKNGLDKPARLTIRVLWFLFLIVRRVPRPSESGCKKCNALKKYLLGHTFSWKRLSAILCPWNPPWWWFFSLKLNKKCLKTPSKIKGLSFISSNLGNMDFFLIFNCISHKSHCLIAPSIASNLGTHVFLSLFCVIFVVAWRNWRNIAEKNWRNTAFPDLRTLAEGKLIEKPLPAPLRCTCGPQNPLKT